MDGKAFGDAMNGLFWGCFIMGILIGSLSVGIIGCTAKFISGYEVKIEKVEK